MYCEFGSEFWVDAHRHVPASTQPFLFEPDELLTNCGRSSLSLLLEQMDDFPQTALIPAYTCETVSQPFVHYGYRTTYYDCDKSMQPDIRRILDVTAKGPVVFVHMGHFGFPSNAVLAEILPTLRARGCIIVEDTTHSLFDRGSKLLSDCRTASIRKWLGIPSGGVVFPGRFAGRLQPAQALPLEEFALSRAVAMRQKEEYINSGGKIAPEYHPHYQTAEKALFADCRPYQIDRQSCEILRTTDWGHLRRRRRENYRFLLEHLPDSARMQPVFSELPEDCCPLLFPVYVDSDNRGYQQRLAAHKLYCPIHWPPNPYNEETHPGAEYIQSHILSIPCDQRYSLEDMGRIVEIVRQVV